MLRVLIVADFEFIPEPLSSLIWKDSDFEIIDYVVGWKKAIEECRGKKPNVVVLYLSGKYNTKQNMIKKMKAIDEKIKILVFSFHDDRKSIALALKNGADGYVLSQEGFQNVSLLMAKAYNNIKCMDNTCFSIGKKYLVDQDQYYDFYRNVHFTEREKEVLELVMEGFSNYEIAARLGISTGRARNIVADLMTKCMVKNRTQLAVLAVRINILNS